MLQIRKACCCYSLRHGSVVIGIGFLLASGIALLMEVALIAEWRHIEERHLDWENRHVTLAFLIVMASLSFVYILFSVTLLKGIKENRRSFFIPWLVWSLVYLIFCLGFIIHGLIIADNIMTISTGPVSLVVCTGGWLYCIVCIAAYYKQMPLELKQEKDKNESNHSKIAVKSEPSIEMKKIDKVETPLLKPKDEFENKADVHMSPKSIYV